MPYGLSDDLHEWQDEANRFRALVGRGADILANYVKFKNIPVEDHGWVNAYIAEVYEALMTDAERKERAELTRLKAKYEGKA